MNNIENMIGAKALMLALEKEGVKQVFGLPGGANPGSLLRYLDCNNQSIGRSQLRLA